MLRAPVCALLACTAVARGQAVDLLPTEARCVHAWHETVATGELRPLRARLCRFDAATGVDAILVRTHEIGAGEASRSLFAQRSVGLTHATVPLGPAVDFVVVRNGIGRESVMTLGADGGIRLLSLAPGQAVATSQLLAMWPGFQRLSAIANGVNTEIIAYDLAGVRIRRATWNGGQLGPSSIVIVPPNITAVEGIDWNGDGVPELVLSTPATTYVQSWNLTPVVTLPVVPPATSAVVTTCVSHATSGGDHLVTLVWDGQQTAMTWMNAATTGALSLGDWPVGSVATYDRDGDGDDDVLVGHATRSLVRVLLREAGGYSQRTAAMLVGSAAAERGVTAVCGGDIDGDGDGDVLAWNRESMNLHTLHDAARSDQAPVIVFGDIEAATIGPTVELPVTVVPPMNLPQLQPAATSFLVQFRGWLVDPATGFVLPQRQVDREVVLAPGADQLTTPIAFTLPPTHQGVFHLQLQARVVAVLASGVRRDLPGTVLHLTNDFARERLIEEQVERERTGCLETKGSGDGGGDGNILGTKTGKHQVGAPPQ